MNIAQATPRCGPPSWRYLDSLVDWHRYHAAKHPEVGVRRLYLARYMPIDIARNLLVLEFLKTDAEYLWFLDQDAVFLPQTLDRLMSRKMPIVSALEMMRLPTACWPMALKGPPDVDGQYRIQSPEVYEWIAQNLDAMTNDPQMMPDTPQDSLLETGFTGCHCLLIRRDVLEEMEQPWFKGYDPGGEDQYFCLKAAGMGVATYVDLSVLVGHTTTDRTIGAFDFMAAHWFKGSKVAAEEAESAQRMKEWEGT